MKTIHYLFTAMLALSACASFTACSSDDVTTAQQKVETADGFYMTLTLKGSDAKGTRTSVISPTEDATADESTVSSGVVYLFHNGAIAYKKTISTAEWKDALVPQQGRDGQLTVRIPITNVKTGTPYQVYFLANYDDDDPGNTTIESGDKMFVNGFAEPGKFIMFNQNDLTVSAKKYLVSFTEDNKNESTPAKLTESILIERAVARIDVPTSVTQLDAPTADQLSTLSDKQKEALKDARDNVKSITLEKYAISNLAKKTYIMQHWSEDNFLTIPGYMNYWQTYDEFGTETRNDGTAFFKALANATPDYVFENTTSEAHNSTAMYFQYKVELNSYANADFTDGTFYRYDGKIYTRLADIIDSGKYGTNPFGKTADELLTQDLLRTNDGKLGAQEIALEEFRKAHNIQVFPQGLVYYRQLINDVHYVREGWNSIQRNSIYKLNVKSIWDIGADVPNGDNKKDTEFYYLNVEVSVNPWVLNTQNVILK